MNSGRVVFASRPGADAEPTIGNFRYESCQEPEVPAGGILVDVHAFSVDPYMRCLMNEDPGVDYLSRWELNEPPSGGGVGKVLATQSDKFKVGDYVYSFILPWQNPAPVPAPVLEHVQKVEFPQPTAALGVLGIPGLTAWVGIKKVSQVGPTTDCVLVSGAAGATGLVAGGISKLLGAKRVVGICGTDEKCEVLRSSGYDVAINYKTSGGSLQDEVERACPGGIDVYFDNVGGAVTDAVIPVLKPGGKIALCGQISVYNTSAPYPPPLSDQMQAEMDRKGAIRERFVVLSHQDAWPEGLGMMGKWLMSGELKYQETVTKGLENIGAAFVSMMNGGNIGKALVSLQ